MAFQLVLRSIGFTFMEVRPRTVEQGLAISTRGAEARFDVWTDDGGRGTITFPLGDEDLLGPLQLLVDRATQRCRALLEEAA